MGALRKQGVKIALGSASKNAVPILERLNLMHHFDAIIDGTSVSAAKPDPEVFLKGAEAVGQRPEDCVVFEDSQAGVIAAERGGMACVGIGEPSQLSSANIVVSGLHEVSFESLQNLF
jgi:beta-phosphoglucomutase